MRYSNPRLSALVENWPYGERRLTALFRVETHPQRGQRISRVTIDPKTGRWSHPRRLTYHKQVRIMDGEDGQTYIVSDMAPRFYFLVTTSDFKVLRERILFADLRFKDLEALFTGHPELRAPSGAAPETLL